jgi:hypothetical protein
VRDRVLYSWPTRSKSTLKNTRLKARIVVFLTVELLVPERVLDAVEACNDDSGVGDNDDSREASWLVSVSDRRRRADVTWLSCEGAKGSIL